MQKRLWLGVLVVGLPTAGIFGVACGGSTSDDSSANVDSGSDVTQADTSAADVVTISDAGKCDGASLSDLSLPDASLGDSGASTATCVACMKSSCASDITKCNGDCVCKEGVDDALNCVAAAGTLDPSCLGGLTGNASATALGECIYFACQTECGLGGFGDGGVKDASDDGG